MKLPVYYSDRHQQRVAQQIKINNRSYLYERTIRLASLSLAVTLWFAVLALA